MNALSKNWLYTLKDLFSEWLFIHTDLLCSNAWRLCFYWPAFKLKSVWLYVKWGVTGKRAHMPSWHVMDTWSCTNKNFPELISEYPMPICSQLICPLFYSTEQNIKASAHPPDVQRSILMQGQNTTSLETHHTSGKTMIEPHHCVIQAINWSIVCLRYVTDYDACR